MSNQKILTTEPFSENLRRIRKNHKMSQNDVVIKLNTLGSPISRSTYSLIELGRANIFITDLVALQQIYNVDFSLFFEGISTSR